MKITAWLLFAGLMLIPVSKGLGQSASPVVTPGSIALRTETLSNAVAGEGIYVKVDARGGIIRSTGDGIWKVCNLNVKTFVRAVLHAKGLFVAVGGSYLDEPAVILTSSDGVTWVRRSIPGRANLYSAAYGNGLFVAVGDNGTILTSPNGLFWKSRDSHTSNVLLSAVTCQNGTFIIVGDSGTFLVSTNGIDWPQRTCGRRKLRNERNDSVWRAQSQRTGS